MGEESEKTGCPIIYTSADSVLQIAASVSTISIDSLYELCEEAREICIGEWEVGRIIARPFKRENGIFYRLNESRKDYPLPFSEETVLDKLMKKKFQTVAFGEVGELFNMKGISYYEQTRNNKESIDFILFSLRENFKGIVIGNLVDFDMIYGHRRNSMGFKKSLEEFDARLKDILISLNERDLLIITADHGNDPTFKGTDHTREYVPLLVYGKKIKQNINLNIRQTFSDIGRTISENFHLNLNTGTSFLSEIKLN